MNSWLEPDLIVSESPEAAVAVAEGEPTLTTLWNWKAAALSAACRAPIFVVTTYSYGWRAVTLASSVEALYRAGTAGLFAALTQAVRNRRPTWLAVSLVIGMIPATALALDYVLHLAMGTPNLMKGMLVSLIVSAFTSLFSWYSMRRGTLLAGKGQASLASDLCRMPGLVLEFFLEPARWIGHCTRRLFARREI